MAAAGSPSIGTKIALSVDQRVSKGEVLGHAHDRVVDSHVAVRVVFPNDVSDNTSGFLRRSIPVLPNSDMAYRIRRWTGFNPSQRPGSARPIMTLIARSPCGTAAFLVRC
jgi:hypothetical protein